MGRRILRKEGDKKLRGSEYKNEQIQIDLSQYWNRLKNLIPAEVSTLYVAGKGVIPIEQKSILVVWVIFCFFCTAVFIAEQSQYGEGEPNIKYQIDKIHVFISCISFTIWVYALGDPFRTMGIYNPWLGSLIMLGWTFIVPFIYKGNIESSNS